MHSFGVWQPSVGIRTQHQLASNQTFSCQLRRHAGLQTPSLTLQKSRSVSACQVKHRQPFVKEALLNKAQDDSYAKSLHSHTATQASNDWERVMCIVHCFAGIPSTSLVKQWTYSFRVSLTVYPFSELPHAQELTGLSLHLALLNPVSSRLPPPSWFSLSAHLSVQFCPLWTGSI